MYEKINESIEVLVKFSGEKVMPTFFKWSPKTYKIEKLNLVHKKREGDNDIYYFSVSDEINFFRLAFSTRDMKWVLEELFYEG